MVLAYLYGYYCCVNHAEDTGTTTKLCTYVDYHILVFNLSWKLVFR